MATYIGSTLTYTDTFLNASGVAADPTTVSFWLLEAIDGTTLEWSYAASPVAGVNYPIGANPITKSATGVYSLLWVARKAERHVGHWLGAGNSVNQADETTFKVRHSGIPALDS